MGPPFWPPEQRNEPSLTSFRRFLRLEVRAYRGFSDGFLTEFYEVGEESCNKYCNCVMRPVAEACYGGGVVQLKAGLRVV